MIPRQILFVCGAVCCMVPLALVDLAEAWIRAIPILPGAEIRTAFLLGALVSLLVSMALAAILAE